MNTDLFSRALDIVILGSVFSGTESDLVLQGPRRGHLLSGMLGAATKVSHVLRPKLIFRNREAAVFVHLHLAILLWSLHAESGTCPGFVVISGPRLPAFE